MDLPPGWLDFVAAMRAAPGDDTPRLVAADWLEERGFAERAELVRVQCGMAAVADPHAAGRPLADFLPDARRRPRCGCPACDVLAREHELSGAVGSAEAYRLNRTVRRPFTVHHEPVVTFWLGKPPGRGRDDPEDELRLEFDRGFVARVTTAVGAWLAHGPAVAAAHPVEGVTLADREPFENYQGRWVWARSHVNHDADLWRLVQDDPHRVTQDFCTRDAAIAALSRAAADWAWAEALRRAGR